MISNEEFSKHVTLSPNDTIWSPEDVHGLCTCFKSDLIKYFEEVEYGTDETRIAAKRQAVSFVKSLSNLTPRQQIVCRRQLHKVFSDFYILDGDFNRLRNLIIKNATRPNPCILLIRDLGILYNTTRVIEDDRQQMLNYYSILADSLYLKSVGAQMQKESVDESGNEVVAIAVTIGNGITAYAASIQSGPANVQALNAAYEQAKGIYRHSAIMQRSLQQVIVDALNKMAKALPMFKPILHYFHNFTESNARIVAQIGIQKMEKIKLHSI